mmetsp:Transcript_12609/g.23712  ORF Transcript_12609/g.23712 Transcript_12609/m.23712 type:complete len:210 (+) Transcript_12609:103-732(+)
MRFLLRKPMRISFFASDGFSDMSKSRLACCCSRILAPLFSIISKHRLSNLLLVPNNRPKKLRTLSSDSNVWSSASTFSTSLCKRYRSASIRTAKANSSCPEPWYVSETINRNSAETESHVAMGSELKSISPVRDSFQQDADNISRKYSERAINSRLSNKRGGPSATRKLTGPMSSVKSRPMKSEPNDSNSGKPLISACTWSSPASVSHP